MGIPTDFAAPRQNVAEHLLRSLDELVRRHRALLSDREDYAALHTELIAAEVTHLLAVTRIAFRPLT
jgi:hypothetical protein